LSEFLYVLTKRTAAEHFDSAALISDSEIKELVEEASQAPSSFNIQHWRFIAVTDMEIKQKLKSAMIESNQRRVADAPVTFLVLGDLQGHEKLEGILNETVHAGLLSREIADVWLTMANGMYGSDPRLARDEAIRIWFAGGDDTHACRWEPRLRQLSYRFQSGSGDGDPEHQRPLCTRHDAHGWSSRFRQ
jgi:nitroreductase